MAAVFSRLPMRVRCATQRDHVFHPEMNYSQTQLDQLDRLTERWVADHLQKGKTSKKDKELVTLEYCTECIIGIIQNAGTPSRLRFARTRRDEGRRERQASNYGSPFLHPTEAHS